MAMFPIFIIGLVAGIALSYTWYLYKKDTHEKEKPLEIITYKTAIESLEKTKEKLQKEINELKNK